ncbi:MAG TPA: hypothetical protein VGG75_12255 [Trebonia sp.]
MEFLNQADVRSAELVITTEPDSPRALTADILAKAARVPGVHVHDVSATLDAVRVAAQWTAPDHDPDRRQERQS